LQTIESVDIQYITNPDEMIKNEVKKMDKYRATMIEMVNHFFDV
jgi:hypothetical protein